MSYLLALVLLDNKNKYSLNCFEHVHDFDMCNSATISCLLNKHMLFYVSFLAHILDSI